MGRCPRSGDARHVLVSAASGSFRVSRECVSLVRLPGRGCSCVSPAILAARCDARPLSVRVGVNSCFPHCSAAAHSVCVDRLQRDSPGCTVTPGASGVSHPRGRPVPSPVPPDGRGGGGSKLHPASAPCILGASRSPPWHHGLGGLAFPSCAAVIVGTGTAPQPPPQWERGAAGLPGTPRWAPPPPT